MPVSNLALGSRPISNDGRAEFSRQHVTAYRLSYLTSATIFNERSAIDAARSPVEQARQARQAEERVHETVSRCWADGRSRHLRCGS